MDITQFRPRTVPGWLIVSLRTILLVLVAVGVTLGALRAFPIAVVSHLKINGAPPGKEEAIKDVLWSALSGANFFSVENSVVETSLSSFPEVKSVEVEKTFPGSVSVSLTLYEPFTRLLVNDSSYVISREGQVLSTDPSSIFTSITATECSPEIGKKANCPGLENALLFANAIPPSIPLRGLQVQPDGAITALIAPSFVVRLGSGSDHRLKIEVLSQMLRRPELEGGRGYLDLTSPATPVLLESDQASEANNKVQL